jgi:small GTP-binding protein
MSQSGALPVLPPKKQRKPRNYDATYVRWDTTGMTDAQIADEAEQTCCVVTFGESNVGKTSLLVRFGLRKYEDTRKSTTGIDFIGASLVLHGKKTRIRMFDTAGQERYRALTEAYLRPANMVFLAFDLSKPSTFSALEQIRAEILERHPTVVCALFGLKADLGVNSWFELEETRAIVKRLNCAAGVYTVSNKSQESVDKAVLSALGVYFALVVARKLRASVKLAEHMKAQSAVSLEESKEAKTGCCG